MAFPGFHPGAVLVSPLRGVTVRPRRFMVSHPFHDGAVEWMGHPSFLDGSKIASVHQLHHEVGVGEGPGFGLLG